MNRILGMALAAGVAFAVNTAVAQNMDDVEIKIEPVRGGLYALYGNGGNIGVSVGEDGVFLIDDQFAPLTDKIMAALATLSDQPVRYLINTHYHGDHTGGNENLGKAGAVIMAHDHLRARLESRPLDQSGGWTSDGAAHGLPVITFSDQMSLHFNGDEARAIHFPHAHTDGDSLIWFKDANVIHMGDLMFNGLFPYIDVDAGGNVDGVLAGYKAAIEMADDETLIIPGHGPLSDRAGLIRNRDMIRTVRDRVAAMIADGKTLEETKAAAPTSEFDEEYTWGFIKPDDITTAIYRSLAPSGE